MVGVSSEETQNPPAAIGEMEGISKSIVVSSVPARIPFDPYRLLLEDKINW